jgi:Na+-transporting methylmalonyl-CoA/oxaloacetate decarboxylase gamma subunit
MRSYFKIHRTWLTICAILTFFCAMLLGQITPIWASSGEYMEEMKPQFNREEKAIVAKMIPRAKSSSVLIKFQVTNGELADVSALDFKEADRPEVDEKDFKSGLFRIGVTNVPTGSNAAVSIVSDFFTGSTEFWVFNEKADASWMPAEAENKALENLVQEMIIPVRDGGKFDSDGTENGQVILIGGPKDSFWGYALGTLFIRFFGIFLVLSVLMFGMMFSGRIFSYFYKPKEPPVSQNTEKKAPGDLDDGVDSNLASAIAVALHLRLSSVRQQEYACLVRSEVTPWTQQGRERLMGGRYHALNRISERSVCNLLRG